MSDISFKMTAATHVGLVRSNNEDNFIVNPDLTGPDWYVPAHTDEVIQLGKNGCLLVVADGMGGMNAGEVASELAVNGIRSSFGDVMDFSEITDSSNHVEAFLKKAIVDADAAIKRKVKDDPQTSGMGTTIVIVWVLENAAHVCWCGDSRAYLFNPMSGLSRLSKDHSYVQELVDSGKLDAELAFDHPNSNIITRSLGDSNVKAQPDYVCKRLTAGDMIILCSDGLCGLVRDEEMLDILSEEYDSIEDYKNALFQAALDAGGYDNITIALLQCVSVEEPQLGSTVAPGESGRKKAALADTEKTGGRKKGRAWLWIVLILLLALCIAAYCLGLVTYEAGQGLHFHLDSIMSSYAVHGRIFTR